jgi:hypothetical protein
MTSSKSKYPSGTTNMRLVKMSMGDENSTAIVHLKPSIIEPFHHIKAQIKDDVLLEAVAFSRPNRNNCGGSSTTWTGVNAAVKKPRHDEARRIETHASRSLTGDELN